MRKNLTAIASRDPILSIRLWSKCGRRRHPFRTAQPLAGPSTPTLRFASSQPGPQPTHQPHPRPRQRGLYLPISILVIGSVIYYLQSKPRNQLSPNTYSDHPISSTTSLGPSHKLITVPLTSQDSALFSNPKSKPTTSEATGNAPAEITIHHLMIKNPDLQIERPYTPINDPNDGEVQVVVKRVKGGEVGRLVHSLKPGDKVGIRGPLQTFSIVPDDYDRIVMISSGTGLAPFLQLLSKCPDRTNTKFHLLHATAKSFEADWVSHPSIPILTELQAKLGDSLKIHRISFDSLNKGTFQSVISRDSKERLMVLVCLPPHLMKPLCGPLTITLGQGELSGLLKDLGLSSDQVYKLE